MSRLNRMAAKKVKDFFGEGIPMSVSELQRLEGSPIDKDDWIPDSFNNERENVQKTMVTQKISVYFIPRKGLNADYPVFVKEYKQEK